eukprot:7385564-Prymnesium_polylepis.1
MASGGEGAIIDAQHMSRVLELQVGASVRFSLLTLANGQSSTNGGGGVVAVNTGSALELSNSSVVNATSGGNGGAMFVTGGSDVGLFNESSIVNSSCEISGGAIATFGSRVTLAPGSFW